MKPPTPTPRRTANRAAPGIVLAGLALLAATAPARISAQVALGTDEAWTVHVTPRLGWMRPADAGPLEGWRPEGLRVTGGPVGGVAIEVRTPIEWLSVRGTVERTVRNNLGFGWGRDDRWDPFTDPFFLSRASAFQEQYALGGLVRPFRRSPIRPVGVLGVGVRHWRWNPGDLAESLVPRFPESRWDRTWHWGAGVEADAEPVALRFEVVDYRARADADALGRVEVGDRFYMMTVQWIGWR